MYASPSPLHLEASRLLQRALVSTHSVHSQGVTSWAVCRLVHSINIILRWREQQFVQTVELCVDIYILISYLLRYNMIESSCLFATLSWPVILAASWSPLTPRWHAILEHLEHDWTRTRVRDTACPEYWTRVPRTWRDSQQLEADGRWRCGPTFPRRQVTFLNQSHRRLKLQRVDTADREPWIAVLFNYPRPNVDTDGPSPWVTVTVWVRAWNEVRTKVRNYRDTIKRY